MTLHAIKITWVGGEHQFFLGLGEIRALQAATGCGPYTLFERVRRNDWRVDDLIDTLRLGLIGSGEMSEMDAGAFVTDLFRKHALFEFAGPVVTILAQVLTQPDGDPVGKTVPAGTESPIQTDA